MIGSVELENSNEDCEEIYFKDKDFQHLLCKNYECTKDDENMRCLYEVYYKDGEIYRIHRTYDVKKALNTFLFFYGLAAGRGGGSEIECVCALEKDNLHGELSYLITIKNSTKEEAVDPSLHLDIELFKCVTKNKIICNDARISKKYVYLNYEDQLFFLVDGILRLGNEISFKADLPFGYCASCKKYNCIQNDQGLCELCCFNNKANSYRKVLSIDDDDKALVCVCCKKKFVTDLGSGFCLDCHHMGCVYFCTDEQYIKIGCSKKFPDNRVKELYTTYHKKFKLLGFIKTNDFRAKEAEIHRKLAPRRLRGEWFDLSVEELKNFLNENGYKHQMIEERERQVSYV